MVGGQSAEEGQEKKPDSEADAGSTETAEAPETRNNWPIGKEGPRRNWVGKATHVPRYSGVRGTSPSVKEEGGKTTSLRCRRSLSTARRSSQQHIPIKTSEKRRGNGSYALLVLGSAGSVWLCNISSM